MKDESGGLTPFPIYSGQDISTRMSLILWGPSSAGKTTWGATAPGPLKLWLSFGSDETVPIQHRTDIKVMNLAGYTAEEVFRHGVGHNPFGLDKLLAKFKEIGTVVCDSVTALQDIGLEKSVGDGIGKSVNFTPTMQFPGRSAYGGRNQNVLHVMKCLLQVTARHNRHIIFTAHENEPRTRPSDDSIISIDMSLGGMQLNTVTGRVSEIWNLRRDVSYKQNQIVSVRTYGFRRPLKTRMFSQKGEPSFRLEYDPSLPDDDPRQKTIAKFYNAWVKGNKLRVEVPKNRKSEEDKDN